MTTDFDLRAMGAKMLASCSTAKEAWAQRPPYAVLFLSLSFFFTQRRSDSNTNREQWQKQVLFLFLLSFFLYLSSSTATAENLEAKRRVTSTTHTHASTPFDNRPCMRMRGGEGESEENKRLMYYATDEDDRKITRQCCRKTRRRKQTRDSFSLSLSLLLVVQGQTHVSIDNGNDEYIVKNMRTIWERIEAKGEKSIFTWPPVKGAESVFAVMLWRSKTTRSRETSEISINHLKAEIRCYSNPVAVCSNGVEIRPRREHPWLGSTRATNARTRRLSEKQNRNSYAVVESYRLDSASDGGWSNKYVLLLARRVSRGFCCFPSITSDDRSREMEKNKQILSFDMQIACSSLISRRIIRTNNEGKKGLGCFVFLYSYRTI